MTQAAKELHLTQSGVSQQIKSLEETLNITLFDRINRRIIPTNEAEILYKECSRRLSDLESALREISHQGKELRGKVRVGFPPSFGNHTLVPVITEFADQHKQIQFDLRTGLASELIPLLQQGKIDFAFVDGMNPDPMLRYEKVSLESLELICHGELLRQYGLYRHDIKFFSQLPYISYTENEAILQSWFQANFGRRVDDLPIRVTVMDCTVAAKLAAAGLGAALLPSRMAELMVQNDANLKLLTSNQTVTNEISLCSLNKRTMGYAARHCHDWLLDRLREPNTTSN